MSRVIDNYKWDQHIREGIEYLDSFWALIPKYLQIRALEREAELSILIRDRNEFHRRCVANDRPGKRHMLPFYWVKKTGFDGERVAMQVPYKVGTIGYDRKMAEFADKIAEVRRGG